MSVKPRRKAEDGAGMVPVWYLAGCISDLGGLMTTASEGVWGGRRMGEDITASRVWLLSVEGVSSYSATESRLREALVFGFAGVCNPILVMVSDVILELLSGCCCLLYVPGC